MSEQRKSDDDSPKTSDSYHGWVVRSVRKIQLKLEKRETDKKNETSQDRAARRTAAATWWIAGFTFVAVGVGFSQAIIANRTLVAISGQLNEMKRSYGPIQETADAARTSADSALAQIKLMEIDQRPWIDISNIQVADEVTFDANGARISLIYELSNVGKSPAISVDTWISAYVTMNRVSGGPTKQFERPGVSILDPAPSMVFADHPITRTVTGYVTGGQVMQVLKGAKIFPISVEVCASYRFFSSQDEHKTCHELLIVGADGKIIFLSEPLVSIPKDDLKITFRPFSGLAD